jgi:hypothetical protein
LILTGVINHEIFVTSIFLDTGASVSLIQQAFLDTIAALHYTSFTTTPQETLYDAQHNPLPVTTKIRIFLKLVTEDAECGDYVTLYVVPQLPYQILLGRGHMYRFIDMIDFTAGKIQLNPENELALDVIVSRSCVIPPDGRCTVLARIPNLSDAFYGGVGQFHPISITRTGNLVPLLISPFLLHFERVDEEDQSSLYFDVWVYNPSYQPWALQRGQILGRVYAYVDEKANTFHPYPTTHTDAPIPSPIDHQVLVIHQGLDIDVKNGERDIDEPATLKELSTNPELTDEQKQQLWSLIHEFKVIFEGNPECPPAANGVQHIIEVTEEKAFKLRNPRFSPEINAKLEAQVVELLKHDQIEPSSSPYCNPLRPVEKPDGRIRMCCDFRKLNSITIPDSYPLPRIIDTLDSLAHAKYFGLIDLAAGYHQIPLRPEDRAKTAFATREGFWQWKRMPEGVINGPATFQRFMDSGMRPHIGKRCWIYIDDILIFGKTWEEFMENLRIILECLKKMGLTAKARKTKLGYEEIKILGHIVGHGTVKPNPEKVRAIVDYPDPTNLRELRSFLGLLNYYRRFIPGLARMAEPLYALLRKDAKYIWTDVHKVAAQRLKAHLSGDPVLHCPDFAQPFIVETDASITGYAAVLSQKNPQTGIIHPIAFISRPLTPAEKNYATTEQECGAIVWAVEQFNIYLSGTPFTLITDHKALTWLQSKRSHNRKLTRWSLQLKEYNFVIQYRAGTEMPHVDALSRHPVPVPTEAHINLIQQNHSDVSVIPTQITYSRVPFGLANSPYIGIYQIHQKSDLYEVERIVDKRVSNGNIEYQVKWVNYPDSANTWEPVDNLIFSPEAIQEYEQTIRQNVQRTVPVETDQKTSPVESESTALQTIPINQPLDHPSADMISKMIEAQRKDTALKPIIEFLETKTMPITDKFSLDQLNKLSNHYVLDPTDHGLYRLRVGAHQKHYNPVSPIRRLVIPRTYRTQMLRIYHANPFAGHLGVEKTYHRIAGSFHWDNMFQDTQEFIRKCQICQTTKAKFTRFKHPVGTIQIPPFPFHTIGIDFMGPLQPPSNGYSHILVMVDHFSRYAIVVPTVDQSAETVAKSVVEHLIYKFGAPMKLLSDRGQNFLSKLVMEVLVLLDIKKVNTTPYHPQTNGLVERFNQTLISILKTLTDTREGKWANYLAPATFAYNTSVQHTLQVSPYFVLFGREARTPGPDSLIYTGEVYNSTIDYINDMQENFAYGHKVAHDNITAAQEHYLAQNQVLKQHPRFQIQDLVWFRRELKPEAGLSAKFRSPWIGPFVVVKILSPITYAIAAIPALDKPATERPQIVHIDRLRPIHMRNEAEIIPADEGEDENLEVPVERATEPLLDERKHDIPPVTENTPESFDIALLYSNTPSPTASQSINLITESSSTGRGAQHIPHPRIIPITSKQRNTPEVQKCTLKNLPRLGFKEFPTLPQKNRLYKKSPHKPTPKYRLKPFLVNGVFPIHKRHTIFPTTDLSKRSKLNINTSSN